MSIKLKYPLAFNLDGEPVRIPANACVWRVRRVASGSLAFRRGGDCKIVNGPDGSPLDVSLGSTIADLSADVACGGVYRLDAVNESLRVLLDIEPIYVEVQPKTSLDLFSLAAETWFAAKGLSPLLPRSQQARPTLAPEAHHANS